MKLCYGEVIALELLDIEACVHGLLVLQEPINLVLDEDIWCHCLLDREGNSAYLLGPTLRGVVNNNLNDLVGEEVNHQTSDKKV